MVRDEDDEEQGYASGHSYWGSCVLLAAPQMTSGAGWPAKRSLGAALSLSCDSGPEGKNSRI